MYSVRSVVGTRGQSREDAARCTSYSRATRFVLRGMHVGERTRACVADARTVVCGAHAILQVGRGSVGTGGDFLDTTELLERGADLRVHLAERGAPPGCARHFSAIFSAIFGRFAFDADPPGRSRI